MHQQINLARSPPKSVSSLAQVAVLRFALSRPCKHIARLLGREVIAELLELARRRNSGLANFCKHLRFVGLRCHERRHQVRQCRAQRVDLAVCVSPRRLVNFSRAFLPVIVVAQDGLELPRTCALATARVRLRAARSWFRSTSCGCQLVTELQCRHMRGMAICRLYLGRSKGGCSWLLSADHSE